MLPKTIQFHIDESLLNKAHIQYVESKLIQKLKNAKQAGVFSDNNLKNEEIPTLDAFDTKTAEDYLEQIISLCRVMDLNIFDQIESVKTIINPSEEFVIKRNNEIIARMIIGKEKNLNKFILLAGSKLLSILKPGKAFNRQQNLELLKSLGIIKDGILLKDHVFDNPSLPGALVVGSTSNGWIDWIRSSDSKPLNDIVDRDQTI